IRNRAPATIQITIEQLLREARCLNSPPILWAQECQESAFRAPKQRVEDLEEVYEYCGCKRIEFEERV
ncbi:hypothetical protein EDD22DRAFT_732307, partial [Suillus occidentalis]